MNIDKVQEYCLVTAQHDFCKDNPNNDNRKNCRKFGNSPVFRPIKLYRIFARLDGSVKLLLHNNAPNHRSKYEQDEISPKKRT